MLCQMLLFLMSEFTTRQSSQHTCLALGGLFPNIQVLEPLFALAGDPLPADASPGAELRASGVVLVS